VPASPRPSLSVFFPAYNDAGTIASLALIAHMTARGLTDQHEVIVVDDGSPDHTGELLDEMARHFSWLKVVHHPANRGYGGALRTGFETASGELVFYTDGDAQYDPRELVRLYQRVASHLSYAQTYYRDPALTAKLSGLVARSAAVVYGNRPRTLRVLGRFFTSTFPAAVWHLRRFVLAATLLFVLTARGFGSRAVLRDAAIGFVLALIAFLGFTLGLGLTLPAGPFEFLI